MAKPWEKETHDFTDKKKKKKKAKKAAKSIGPGSMAEDVIGELTKRNKNLAPYSKTGPGA